MSLPPVSPAAIVRRPAAPRAPLHSNLDPDDVNHAAATAIGRGAAAVTSSRFSLVGKALRRPLPTTAVVDDPPAVVSPQGLPNKAVDAVQPQADADAATPFAHLSHLLPKAVLDSFAPIDNVRAATPCGPAPTTGVGFIVGDSPPQAPLPPSLPPPVPTPAHRQHQAHHDKVDDFFDFGCVNNSAGVRLRVAARPDAGHSAAPPQGHVVTPAELLGPLSSVFQFSSFNKVQAQCAPALYTSDASVVIAAPTGSGKTALLELAIVRLFRDRLLRAFGSPSNAPPCSAAVKPMKAVYVCPIKALACEKYEAWQRKFGALGLQVVMETGDGRTAAALADAKKNLANTAPEQSASTTEPDLATVLAADILVTTPERWDSITRRWRQAGAVSLVESVRLLLVDEVHVLGERRGAVIEALVSRMKTVSAELRESAERQRQRQLQSPVADSSQPLVSTDIPPYALESLPLRFVAVSGTMPNADDVAEWLEAPHLFVFSDADRPIPLRTHVTSVPSSSRNSFQFDKLLTFRLLPTLRQYSAGKPALIFCCSRRECSQSASHLAQEAKYELVDAGASQLNIPTAVLRTALLEAGTRCEDASLRQSVPFGVAFHHAALSPSDRRLVEQLFVAQHLRVICTTTTLAMGVNLPARLVVVKGTAAPARATGASATASGGFASDDLPLSEVAQMCGRAGRAGLDTEGVAVVLVSERKAALYMPLDTAFTNGTGGGAQSVIESTLHENMIEHVNAEVGLGTITSPAVGVSWLRTTFLWTRLQKNPQHYGITAQQLMTTKKENDASDDDVDHGLTDDEPLRVRRLARRADDVDESTALLTAQGPLSGSQRHQQNTAHSPEAQQQLEGSVGSRRFARSLIKSMIKELLKEGCVDLQRCVTVTAGADGPSEGLTTLSSTRLGRIMAQYYLDFDSVRLFNRRIAPLIVPPTSSYRFARFADDDTWESRQEDHEPNDAAEADDDDAVTAAAAQAPVDTTVEEHPVPKSARVTMRQLLEVICQANELRECRMRLGDKQHLNTLNTTAKYPLMTGGVDPKTKKPKRVAGGREVKHNWHKVFLLAQAALDAEGSLPALTDWSLRNDCLRVLPVLARLSKALVDFCSFVGGGVGLVEAWNLQRCVERKLWYDSPRSARQLDGVGDAIARALERGGFGTLRGVMDADPRRIEAAASRHPPFGSDLVAQARSIPVYCVTLEKPTADGADVSIAVLPVTDANALGLRRTLYTLIVVDTDTGDLLLTRRFRCGGSKLVPHHYTVKVPNRRVTLMAHLLNESLLGLDCKATCVATPAARRNGHFGKETTVMPATADVTVIKEPPTVVGPTDAPPAAKSHRPEIIIQPADPIVTTEHASPPRVSRTPIPDFDAYRYHAPPTTTNLQIEGESALLVRSRTTPQALHEDVNRFAQPSEPAAHSWPMHHEPPQSHHAPVEQTMTTFVHDHHGYHTYGHHQHHEYHHDRYQHSHPQPLPFQQQQQQQQHLFMGSMWTPPQPHQMSHAPLAPWPHPLYAGPTPPWAPAAANYPTPWGQPTPSIPHTRNAHFSPNAAFGYAWPEPPPLLAQDEGAEASATKPTPATRPTASTLDQLRRFIANRSSVASATPPVASTTTAATPMLHQHQLPWMAPAHVHDRDSAPPVVGEFEAPTPAHRAPSDVQFSAAPWATPYGMPNEPSYYAPPSAWPQSLPMQQHGHYPIMTAPYPFTPYALSCPPPPAGPGPRHQQQGGSGGGLLQRHARRR